MKKFLLLLILILCLAFTLTGFSADLFGTYDQRIKLTIDHTKIDSDLTWFPVMAQFGQLQVPYPINKNCRRPGMQAIYDSTADKTFIVFTGADTHPYITYYDHANKIFGNAVKVGASPSEDYHHYPMLLIDSSGYLWVFYGSHDTTLRYAKSDNVRDISAWTDAALANATYATYPFPVEDDSGDIYVFYRKHGDGVMADYHAPLFFVKTADGGSNWSAATVCIENTDAGEEGIEEVYLGKIAHEAAHDAIPEKLHMIWTMAGGSIHNEFHEDIHYAYFKFSDDHFYAADDTDLGVAIDDSELEANTKVVDTGAADDKDTPYINFVDYKSDGTPIIVYGDDVSGGWYYNEYDSGWGTPIKLTNYTDYACKDMIYEDSTIKILLYDSSYNVSEYTSTDGSNFSDIILFNGTDEVIVASGYVIDFNSLIRIITYKPLADFTNNAPIYLYPGHNISIFDELSADASFDKCTFTSSDEETQLHGDCGLFNAGLKRAIYDYSKTGWEISSGADTDSYFYYDGDASNNTAYISRSGGIAAQSVWDDYTKLRFGMNDVVVDYDTQYEADVEPDSDGWTLIGSDYSSSDGDILTIDTSADDGYICYYYQTPDVNFDDSFYLKTRVKAHTDMDNVNDGCAFYAQDGTQDERILFKIRDGSIIYIYNNEQYGVVTMDTTTDYHIYELYVKGTTFWIYVDGVQKATDTVDSHSVSDSVRFGDVSATSGFMCKTYIDYIYYALDVTDNPLLAILDSTSNNNDGTKKAANQPVEENGREQHFDGLDDYIITPTLLDVVPANGTVSIYLAPDDTSEAEAKYLFYKKNDADNRLRCYWLATAEEGSRFVGFEKYNATVSKTVTSTTSLTNTYYLITGTWGSSGMVLYVNGTSEDTDPDTNAIVNGTDYDFTIGSSYNPLGTYVWDGVYRELRVSSSQRNAAWTKAEYNSLFDTLITYGSEETPTGITWNGITITKWNGITITKINGK